MIDEKWIAVLLMKFFEDSPSPFEIDKDSEMVRTLFYNSGALDFAQYLIANLGTGDA